MRRDRSQHVGVALDGEVHPPVVVDPGCLPKAFWTSSGLAIRLAANGSVDTARTGFHGLHCGAGRLEWSEDLPRPHRRLRLLKLPCQTHWLVAANLLAKDNAIASHGLQMMLTRVPVGTLWSSIP